MEIFKSKRADRAKQSDNVRSGKTISAQIRGVGGAGGTSVLP